jgi:hypothetical protein
MFGPIDVNDVQAGLQSRNVNGGEFKRLTRLAQLAMEIKDVPS